MDYQYLLHTGSYRAISLKALPAQLRSLAWSSSNAAVKTLWSVIVVKAAQTQPFLLHASTMADVVEAVIREADAEKRARKAGTQQGTGLASDSLCCPGQHCR